LPWPSICFTRLFTDTGAYAGAAAIGAALAPLEWWRWYVGCAGGAGDSSKHVSCVSISDGGGCPPDLPMPATAPSPGDCFAKIGATCGPHGGTGDGARASVRWEMRQTRAGLVMETVP